MKAAEDCTATVTSLAWTAGEIGSVTMSGEGAATLNITGAYDKELTVDASSLTGKIDFQAAAATKAIEVNYKGSEDASQYVITTGGGADTITVGNGSGTISAKAGADMITLGEGSDTVVLDAAGVAASATNFAAATVAADDTITFGNGVKTIAKFGDGDKLDVTTTTISNLIGATAASAAAGTYVGYGNIDDSGVFTLAAGYSESTKAAIVFYDLAASTNLSTADNVVVLTGIDGDLTGDLA